jgi:hypothetical protein
VQLATAPAEGTKLVLRLNFADLDLEPFEITLEKWTEAWASKESAELDFTNLRPERPLIVATLEFRGERLVQPPNIDGTDFGDRPLEYIFDLEGFRLPPLSAVFSSSATCSHTVVRQGCSNDFASLSELAIELTTRVRANGRDETLGIHQTSPSARARALLECPALASSPSTLERYALIGLFARPNGEEPIRRAAREQLELVARQAFESLAASKQPVLADDWDRRFVARFINDRAAVYELRGALEDAFRCFGDVIQIIGPVTQKSADLADLVLLLSGTHGQAKLLLRAGRNEDALTMVQSMHSILAAAEADHPSNPFLAVWRSRAEVFRARASRDPKTQEEAARSARAVIDALVAKCDTPQRRRLRDSVESALTEFRGRRRFDRPQAD